MPTYDYRCDSCGEQFEHFQNMSDPPLTECPACRGPLRRLIGTGAGLIFKGSGFYATDYRKNPSGGESESGSDGEGKPAGDQKGDEPVKGKASERVEKGD